MMLGLLFNLACFHNSQIKTSSFQDAVVEKPIKVALVLGGGGARGFAHIGVLEELENAGIEIDTIVGCSAGSLVGALYAKYKSAKILRKILIHKKNEDLFEVDFLKSKLGLANRNKLKTFLSKHLGNSKFSDLKIGLNVVATDLVTGKLINFKEGNLIKALLASSAYPIVFPPVKYKDYVLVDGGVLDPIPCDLAKKTGAKLVIAVDISKDLEPFESQSMFSLLKRSMELGWYKHTKDSLKKADLVLHPDLKKMGTFSDKNNHKAYQLGKIEAKRNIEKIKELLRNL